MRIIPPSTLAIVATASPMSAGNVSLLEDFLALSKDEDNCRAGGTHID
jgi:hypothetical protein